MRIKRPSLRTRVTAGFAAGALLLSVAMALLSYEVTRGFLLAGRERAAVRTTNVDANVVRTGMDTQHPDIVEVLRSVDTGGNRRIMLRRDGTWYARNADAGVTEAVPSSLQQLVEAGRPGIQRVRTDSGPALAIGVPLSPSTSLYAVDSLYELDHTLRVLALVLTLVAAGITVAGAGLGWYTTRRVLRPLASVTQAAQEITAGDFSARLDPAAEPELERLTTSFNQMVDQLSQRMERDRRFAADVSHELRSPLQTLTAAVSVLINRTTHLDERTTVAVNLIADETTRFQNLVTDLLELARSDQPPERTTIDLATLARDVCRLHGIPTSIVEVRDGAHTTCHVDRRRVEQMLTNLLDNADRYGGGPVAIRVGRKATTIYLEVDDEGPGVMSQDREKIFDRFERGRTANTRANGDGTGLGLALVAQHAAAHGGQVTVLDRPGGGARFRVELPEVTP